MDKAPELNIGDIVMVYIRRMDKPNVISATITSVAKNNAVWEYNHDTPAPFYYSDVQYVQRGNRWKKR